MIPTEQTCPICGDRFEGSDVIGDPCPNCIDPVCNLALSAIDAQAAVNEMIRRLKDACNGHPNALIPWPHRLLHDTISLLDRLAAENRELREKVAVQDFTLETGRTYNPETHVRISMVTLIAIRDALVINDVHEAYHQLRVIADPEPEVGRDHWEAWERAALTAAEEEG